MVAHLDLELPSNARERWEDGREEEAKKGLKLSANRLKIP
jgi:hypothetical protein